MAERGDQDSGRDDAVILELAEAIGDTHWHKPEGTLYRIGDSETQFAIAHRSGRWLAESTDRGHTVEEAEFSDGATARAWLVAQLAPSVRSRRGWPPIHHRHVEPRARFVSGPSGSRLAWDGGWAVFRSSDDFDATSLSWVVAVGIPAYVASFQDLHGRPHFPLDPSVLREWPPPPPERAPELTPVRLDPARGWPRADLETAERIRAENRQDLPVIDEAAAEIGWYRTAATGVGVLTYGDPRDLWGRVISVHDGRFAYGSPNSQKGESPTMASFSDPGSAQRFLVMDMGATLRTRRRLPILRAKTPAPGFTLTRHPLKLEVEWDGGNAVFPSGYLYGNPMLFTWCANHSLTDIVTTYRDPNGHPLLVRT
jgi:hypothetical protein